MSGPWYELGPPDPPKRACPPPRSKGEGTHSPAGGGSQLVRLATKPNTLLYSVIYSKHKRNRGMNLCIISIERGALNTLRSWSLRLETIAPQGYHSNSYTTS